MTKKEKIMQIMEIAERHMYDEDDMRVMTKTLKFEDAHAFDNGMIHILCRELLGEKIKWRKEI